MAEQSPADLLAVVLAAEQEEAEPDTDDPLAGLPQSPLDPSPETAEEEARRKHLAPFIFDLLDRTRPAGVRENALRHLVVCDPARAIGALATLAANGIQALEETWGDPDGTVVTLMRADLAANS